jgi:mersacidin/lichenicidin family type 2 lantibiotic
MSNLDVIRAWKDAAYRESLTEAQRALLLEHPTGLIEWEDSQVAHAAGAIVTDLPVK